MQAIIVIRLSVNLIIVCKFMLTLKGGCLVQPNMIQSSFAAESA